MSRSDPLRALEELGFTPFFHQQWLAISEDGDPRSPQRIAAEQRGSYSLMTPGGSRRALLASSLHQSLSAEARPCVGDWVLSADADTEPARIVHVFERMSALRRKKAGRTSEAQLIAANVDWAIVVHALVEGEPVNVRSIERYVALIVESGARPLVLLSKADLCGDARERALELRQTLRDIPVLIASGREGSGVEELRAELGRGETAVLLGPSGAGKSTLTNRLLGSEQQRVNPVRDGDLRGRHTTTQRELFVLPGGALLIDTPGMRELGLWADVDAEQVRGFDDIDALGDGCRFRDCCHAGEPGCAVQAAIDAGALDPSRLAHRHKLQRELDWQRQRHDVVLRQEVQRKWKAMARHSRAHQARKRGE